MPLWEREGGWGTVALCTDSSDGAPQYMQIIYASLMSLRLQRITVWKSETVVETQVRNPDIIDPPTRSTRISRSQSISSALAGV